MADRVLITGGAGFIGSHLADTLLARGCHVVALDNLDPQVHPGGERPAYLDRSVELVVGDVRNPDTVARLISSVDVVFHLAAAVGVGQSMYEVRRYADVNTVGAATLLEAIVSGRRELRKLVVASSMSVYGEGAYLCARHGRVDPPLRAEAQLAARDWEVRCPKCGAALDATATPEDKRLAPASVYAVTKRDQEEMFLSVGTAYRIPTVALRFFNIYGPRQALSNPYTGVAAIFCAQLLNRHAPLVFEDGRQSRDFIHVADIVRACVLATEREEADYQVFNIGTGRSLSVRELASILAGELGWHGEPEVANRYRAGDIRHCFADISRARQLLGFEPCVPFEDGVGELVGWVKTQERVADSVRSAADELAKRGLAR